MSLLEKPASRRISPPCSPRRGGYCRIDGGVFAPGCCRTGDAQRAFGRMFDGLKQSNRGEMRIVDQAVEVVQRRMA